MATAARADGCVAVMRRLCILECLRLKKSTRALLKKFNKGSWAMHYYRYLCTASMDGVCRANVRQGGRIDTGLGLWRQGR